MTWPKKPFLHTTQEILQMSNLPLEDYVEWMLLNNHYDIDAHTGVITNLRTGRALKQQQQGTGYLKVSLSFSRDLCRQITVHRMLAIKLWGASAVKGAQVGHIDGNRQNNSEDKLRLFYDVSEHKRHDKPVRTGVPLGNAVACACCGTLGGYTRHWTPERVDGQKYGIDGKLCHTCYARVVRKAKSA